MIEDFENLTEREKALSILADLHEEYIRKSKLDLERQVKIPLELKRMYEKIYGKGNK